MTFKVIHQSISSKKTNNEITKRDRGKKGDESAEDKYNKFRTAAESRKYRKPGIIYSKVLCISFQLLITTNLKWLQIKSSTIRVKILIQILFMISTHLNTN